MSIDLSKIEALGTEPIPGESPGGVKVQGEDEYDKAEAAFTALTALSSGMGTEVQALGEEAPSWEKLAETSISILSEKSKTIRVATWLSIALFHEEGLAGLAAGVKLIDNFLKNFWDTMFPPLKLIKGRMSAIQFVSTQVAGESDAPGGMLEVVGTKLLEEFGEDISQNPSQSAFEAAYEELVDNLKSIEEALASMESIRTQIYELFPQDKLPVIGSLTDTLKKLKLNFAEEVKKNKREEAPSGEEAAGDAPARTSAPAAGSAGPSAGVAAASSASSPDEARKAMVRLAPMLREADPADPAAYRLARMGVWANLKAVPPVKEGNQTQVPPGSVNKNLIEASNNLLSTSNWMNLLNQAESRFPTAPLWLDTQYHVYRSLKGMGPAFEAAARAVADELATLLNRLPGLEGLAFAGGIPFADAATAEWIQNQVMTGDAGGSGGGGGGGGGAKSDGALDAALEEARALAADGKLPQGLRLLQGGPPGSTSLRDRFLWRMAMARMAQEAGKAHLTRPIWESLLEEIDSYRLESWDPDLCVPVLSALYRIAKADKTQAERAQSLFGRLCQADVAAGLSAEKG